MAAEESGEGKALSLSIEDVGKRVKASKKRITFKFCFLGGPEHTVTLAHSVVSGKKKITVDGMDIYEHKEIVMGEFRHPFQLKGHLLSIIIDGSEYEYDLLVDGRPFRKLPRISFLDMRAAHTASKEAGKTKARRRSRGGTGSGKEVDFDSFLKEGKSSGRRRGRSDASNGNIRTPTQIRAAASPAAHAAPAPAPAAAAAEFDPFGNAGGAADPFGDAPAAAPAADTFFGDFGGPAAAPVPAPAPAPAAAADPFGDPFGGGAAAPAAAPAAAAFDPFGASAPAPAPAAPEPSPSAFDMSTLQFEVEPSPVPAHASVTTDDRTDSARDLHRLVNMDNILGPTSAPAKAATAAPRRMSVAQLAAQQHPNGMLFGADVSAAPAPRRSVMAPSSDMVFVPSPARPAPPVRPTPAAVAADPFAVLTGGDPFAASAPAPAPAAAFGGFGQQQQPQQQQPFNYPAGAMFAPPANGTGAMPPPVPAPAPAPAPSSDAFDPFAGFN